MIESIEFINPGFGLSDLAYGPLNSDHQHASFAVVINNSTIDFSEDTYHLKSPLIHAENKDGRAIHRHASNIPVIDFFNTIAMNIMVRVSFRTMDQSIAPMINEILHFSKWCRGEVYKRTCN